MVTTDVSSPTVTYKCKDGYICGEGSTTEEGTEECAVDQYCQAGVPYDCDSGTYSLARGLTKQSECIECPPGKYCPSRSVGITDCTAGYFCPGNMDKAPNDASYGTAYECTAGHYCPTGSPQEVKCPPGSYSNAVLQTECTPCAAGTYQD